jgi:hypothetical protein
MDRGERGKTDAHEEQHAEVRYRARELSKSGKGRCGCCGIVVEGCTYCVDGDHV